MQLVEGVSLDWIIRRLRESADLVYVDEIRRAGREDRESSRVPSGGMPAPTSGGLCRDSWYDFAHVGLQVALALPWECGGTMMSRLLAAITLAWRLTSPGVA